MPRDQSASRALIQIIFSALVSGSRSALIDLVSVGFHNV